ncbi:hypothetical protein F4804DRAFT_328028 [Jackrogersella minutella]|nr:hypothetical protein F4804DRAFT_328028 [Jackrogersella minutella]
MSDATHMVVGIEWGAQTLVSITASGDLISEGDSVEHYIQSQVQRLRSLTETPTSENASSRPTTPSQALRICIEAYGDIFPDTGIVLSDVANAAHFLNNIVPSDIKHMHQGKGRPVAYTLLPLGILSIMTGYSHMAPSISHINTAILQKFVDLFDQCRIMYAKLEEYHATLSRYGQYVPVEDIQVLSASIEQYHRAKASLKSQYASSVYKTRCGTVDSVTLDKLYNDMKSILGESQSVLNNADAKQKKLEFIDSMVKKGAVYIGHDSPNQEPAKSQQPHNDIYALYFSSDIMEHDQSWPSNQQLLFDIVKDDPPKSTAALVDCDATKKEVGKSRISVYRGGQEITHDLLDRQKFLADKCFATYREDSLECGASIQPPLKRVVVRVGCPGSGCDINHECEWLCSKCEGHLEFGHIDHYIYCGCGRSYFSNYNFRCNNPSHGHEAAYYDKYHLLRLLTRLEQSDYLNILILGETGVGKSTFINAFVNYMSFDTLDDALREDLNSVVPCSFSAQTIDRSSPDGEIKEFKVQVGKRDDEKDGSKGDSATQKTSVYAIQLGSKTIRLIDTPGMGDTRGLEYDQKNMADILATVGSYDKLHGILILLKSNNSRLTVTFNFCVSELLTHLHRSAANNMVFGFTNTRISNYTPGDTFGPLKAILEKHSDIGLSLTRQTTYCFDSESFRYLSAFKSGHELGGIDDFRRSWEYSRDEARRLVGHFQTKPPHSVHNTVSLNRARQHISELTQPMAEVSQLIQTNLSLCEDKREELADTQLTGDDLRKRLWVKKVQYESAKLPRPRTVCKHSSCIEYRDDGESTNTQVTIYKTVCHENCNLTDVTPDQQGHPKLSGCAAFDKNPQCNNCGHIWQDHMHVTYELKERRVTATDATVLEQLKANSDDVSLREAAVHDLDRRIGEYQEEHGQIQQAAAMFGLFLKKHSITPYNDATLEYLDMLIKDEKCKIYSAEQQGISASGNNKKLKGLETDRRRHTELIEALTATTISNDSSLQQQISNPADVDRLASKLYSLKHFGENLKSVKNTITSAHGLTYRERPYRVKMGRRRRQSASDGISGQYAATDVTGRSTSREFTSWLRDIVPGLGQKSSSVLSSRRFR